MKHNLNFIVVTGIAGSGKTTLSRQLAKTLSFPYVDYDTLTEDFLLKIHREFESALQYSAFCSKWRKESYGVFWSTIGENLTLGNSVIASGPCTQELQTSDFFSQFKAQYDLPHLHTINIHLVPSEERLAYLKRKRNLERDQYHQGNWTEFYGNRLTSPPSWDCDLIEVICFSDGETPYKKSLALINNYINSKY